MTTIGSAGARATPGLGDAAVPTSPLLTPPLLQLHRDLSKLVASSFDKPLEEWWSLFDTLAAVSESLRNYAPRFQALHQLTLREAEQLEERSRMHQQQQNKQQPTQGLKSIQSDVSQSSHNTLPTSSASPLSFYSQPLPLPTAGVPLSPHSLYANSVGILGTVPGLVPSLSLSHTRQIEIAYKLLLNLHHDINSAFAPLATAIDACTDFYQTHRRNFTPAQLSLWIVPSLVAHVANANVTSGGGGGVTSPLPPGMKAAGSAHKKSADKKNNKPGKDGSSISGSSASSGGAGGELQLGCSIVDVMRRIESMESLLLQAHHAHMNAWTHLQKTLRDSARRAQRMGNETENSGFSRVQPTSQNDEAAASATTSSDALSDFDLFSAWLHVPVDELFDAWEAAHAPYRSSSTTSTHNGGRPGAAREQCEEELARAKGFTPRVLLHHPAFLREDGELAEEGEHDE